MEQTLQSHQNLKQRFDLLIKEHASLKDATYHALKEGILLGEFEDEIAENQIAAILGVSRTPIREAMLQLSKDGLLEISHGRKARICHLTEKDFHDISLILHHLHSLALSLCIDYVTQDDICQLEETAALISFYTSRKDLRRLSECNGRFHLQIAQAGKNKWLVDVMERLLSYTSLYREYAISRPGRMQTACLEHLSILDAICKRDKEEAMRLIELHVQNAFDAG